MSRVSQCTKNENPKDVIFNSFLTLRNEVAELYLPKEVPTLKEIPEPFEFYRNWVAPNIPVLIKGGARNWPAVQKWTKEYLCKTLRDKQVSVAVTPDGYADAITKTIVNNEPMELFVLPEERLMTFGDFYSKLDDGPEYTDKNVEESKGIFYIQKQNSNMTEEFPELLPDIDAQLLWASETFQSKPVAINLWIGDERAVTSLHKDPFENIYCVISGCKEFILLPPTDRPWLPFKMLSVGQYKETSPGVFEVNMIGSNKWMLNTENGESDSCNSDEVPWIAIDPSCPDYENYPLYKYASPLKVTVEEGDMFYLPSMWFHYVKQSHKCVAVNYWYDMNLDIKYAYFQFVEYLTKFNYTSKSLCQLN